MAKRDACPECGRSSSKFTAAVKAHVVDLLKLHQAEIDASLEAHRVDREEHEKRLAEEDAARVAEAKKWEGHTHTWRKSKRVGRVDCTECGAEELATALEP